MLHDDILLLSILAARSLAGPQALFVLAIFRSSFSFLWPRAHGCGGGYVDMLDARVMVFFFFLFGRPIFLFLYSTRSQVSGHVKGILTVCFKGLRAKDDILPLFLTAYHFSFSLSLIPHLSAPISLCPRISVRCLSYCLYAHLWVSKEPSSRRERWKVDAV